MNFKLGCATCHARFDFSLREDEDVKKIICPSCGKDLGSFKLKINPDEMVMTEFSSDPMPNYELTFRSSDPLRPVAKIDIFPDTLNIDPS